VLIVVPLLLAAFGRWRSALFVVALHFVGPGLVSQLAKNLVDRPRPAADEAAGLYGPLFTVDHGSFPSGHTVSMGIMVVAILALIPPTRRAWRAAWCVVGVLLSVGMVAQRTLINAHWFFDAVSGLVAGIGVALVLWYAFWPWLNRDYRRRGRPRPNEFDQGARRDRHLRGHRRLTDHGGEGFADQRR
jgi:undecaprenyl-diphosphatase